MKDVLPIIENKLKDKKSSIVMLWVCSYWRRVLKDIVTEKYPLEIHENLKRKKEHIYWHTILSEIEPYEFPENIDSKRIIFTTDTNNIDFNLLPKRLESLHLKFEDTLIVRSDIPSLTHLSFNGNFFPYSLLTNKTSKLEFSLNDRNLKEIDLDFEKINIGTYNYIHMRRTKRIFGNISFLNNSYETLNSLTINLVCSNIDLRMFKNLEKLEIGEIIRSADCDCKIDIGLLPKSLLKLNIGCVKELYNEKQLATFDKIKVYKINYNFFSLPKEEENIVYFPPFAVKCDILHNRYIKKIPKSVKTLKCNLAHVNQLENSQIENLLLVYSGIISWDVSQEHDFVQVFDKFPPTLKTLEIYRKIDKIPKIVNSNIETLKVSCEVIHTEHLPKTLKKLYVEKRVYKRLEGKKPANLRIFAY